MIARLFISPSLKVRVKVIEKELQKNTVTKNHPDLLYFKEDEKLGIAESRKIIEHFSLKPYSIKGRIVVLENAGNLTVEAQSALLKTIEELPPEALLLLGASSDANLLPTILSRCEITNLETDPTDFASAYTKDLEKLLNSSIAERFEYVEKLKNREEFLPALVYTFREVLLKPRSNFTKQEVTVFLKELLQAEEWQKQNVNIRAILEYLMLVLPQQK